MNTIYLQKIHINKVRHLENIEIPISTDECKHLIITGKNGSGKTSLLNAIKEFFFPFESRIFTKPLFETQKREIDLTIFNEKFLHKEYHQGNFIFTFFDAKRTTNLITPNSIQKLNIKNVYSVDEKANQLFIQYLVYLKAQRSFARDDNKMDIVESIDKWFENFENYLKELFQDESLFLEFDRINLNFDIVQKNKEKFNLNSLSDGYSAIINIITELIIRMEKKSQMLFNLQGIVLIDEIETHLHIDLQKLILPFLIKMFPNIQFIITTHSPFVLNSVSNAVIYDLENQLLVNDLSAFSVEGIIEGYFNADKYSIELKNLVEKYEQLYQKKELNEEEEEELDDLKSYFQNIPKFMAPELELKIQQIHLSNLKRL